VCERSSQNGPWRFECSNLTLKNVMYVVHVVVKRSKKNINFYWVVRFFNFFKMLENFTYCNTQQHTATRCNTLQHAATHCTALQHNATHCNTDLFGLYGSWDSKIFTLLMCLFCASKIIFFSWFLPDNIFWIAQCALWSPHCAWGRATYHPSTT